MSKRKSRAKSIALDKTDLVFEDDSSDPDLFLQLQNKPKTSLSTAQIQMSKASGSRVSARGKREKKIYDPSDQAFGPVHKKKKEALESRLASVKKTPSKVQVVKTPTKPAEVLVPVKPVSTPQTAKRRLDLDAHQQKEIVEIKEKIQKLEPVASVAKEPIKRIHPIKAIVASEVVSSTPTPPVLSVLKQQRKSVSSERSAITSSTVPVRDSKVPDVSKWSADNVVSYFIEQGFDKKDALKYKEQEIDGEALMILARDDVRNLNFKVGVFVKMWNRILRFQTGKDDPSQSWK